MSSAPYMRGPLASSRLRAALEQIEFTRAYTCRIVDAIEPSRWFEMPGSGVSHVAWQVGHLAMAEYRLTLERTRGPRPDDEQLLPPSFLQLFGKGSVPLADPSPYPSAAEIRAVFDRVHARTLEEVPNLPEQELDAAPATPHPMFDTKLAALFYCTHHEMLHAGQIALLRRLLGDGPMW